MLFLKISTVLEINNEVIETYDQIYDLMHIEIRPRTNIT